MPTQLVQHGPPGGPMPSAVQFSDPWNFDTTLKQHDDKSVSGFSYQPSEKKEALKLKQLHSPKLTHIFTTPPPKKKYCICYIYRKFGLKKMIWLPFGASLGNFQRQTSCQFHPAEVSQRQQQKSKNLWVTLFKLFNRCSPSVFGNWTSLMLQSFLQGVLEWI